MKQGHTLGFVVACWSMVGLTGCDYFLQRYIEDQCDCYLTPCVVSESPIQMGGTDGFAVPDQSSNVYGTQCTDILVRRTYLDDYEKSLILKAESLASTTGPTWVSTKFQGNLLDESGEPLVLIAGAVNAEALTYYANRGLAFQKDASPENPRIYLYYTANVYVSVDADPVAYVALQLTYSEVYGPKSGDGVMRDRMITFDQEGNVTSISGDDVQIVIAIN